MFLSCHLFSCILQMVNLSWLTFFFPVQAAVVVLLHVLRLTLSPNEAAVQGAVVQGQVCKLPAP